MSEFHDRARPHLEAMLEPTEELRGFVVATRQGVFTGGMVALAATDRRLIVLPLSRRIEPKGAPLSIPPERLASAKASDAGGGWWTPTSEIMDAAAARLKLTTTDGEKLTLVMMRGTGPGPLGELGGGDAQREGIEAVARFFAGIAG
jgi:hypothetical protein